MQISAQTVMTKSHTLSGNDPTLDTFAQAKACRTEHLPHRQMSQLPAALQASSANGLTPGIPT